MRLRFRGDGDHERTECVVFGLTFPHGAWVDVTDPPRKLLANPMFERAPDLDAPAYRVRRAKRG